MLRSLKLVLALSGLSFALTSSVFAVDVIVGADITTSPNANRLFKVTTDGTAGGTSVNLNFITLLGVAPNGNSAAQGVTWDATNNRIIATVGSTQIGKYTTAGALDGSVVTQTFNPTNSTTFRNLRMNAAGTKVLSTQIASQRIVDVNPTTLATGSTSYASGATTTSVFQPTAGGFVYGLTQSVLTRFNEDGTGSTAITLSGFSPGTTALRDIFFTNANTFYLTNFTGTGNGGGVWKFTLSGTTATVDTSWGTSGRANISNTYGLARSTDGQFLYVTQNFGGPSSTLSKIALSNGAVTALLSGQVATFGYITVIPEPSTYALAGLATGMLGLIGRRRRKLA